MALITLKDVTIAFEGVVAVAFSTIVQTQHPNLLWPHVGRFFSVIIGHSLSSVALIYNV